MLIAITAVNFSLSGNVLFDATEDSDVGTTVRRVSRTATLDGGAVLSDMGFSHADRTFRINSKGPLSQDDVGILRTMHREHSLVNCAIPEGVFQGVVNQFRDDSGFVEMSFLVKAKI
jgi:hypothetical protein